jgi:hypothetical protein
MQEVTLTDDKGAGWCSPTPSAVAVEPSDTADLAKIARIYIGTAGDLTVILANDTAPVTYVGAQTGYHPLLVKRVMHTGTTATNIVACFMG